MGQRRTSTAGVVTKAWQPTVAKPAYIQVSRARQWVMHQQHMGGQPV